MGKIDEAVMKFVEDTLKKTPKIQNPELFEKAKSVSASIGKLSSRQFNARYPLQVKRKKSHATRKRTSAKIKTQAAAAPTKSRRQARETTEGSRDAVRKVLLQFATDIAGAEERKDLVKVLADVDQYVDKVLKGIAKA